MKRVRALDKITGGFVKVLHASSVSENTRHAHDYRCRDAACEAKLHWVKAHPRRENTRLVPPTFARNPGSAHKEGCSYDYEYKARHHDGLTFYENGLFHLRINFSLGASWADKNPERGDLSAEQRRVAKNRSGYKGVPNMQDLVRFLEKEFGSLESPALENLVLHYQGKDYAWDDVFVPSDQYTKSFNDAANARGWRSKAITVLKPTHEIQSNKNGKRRFVCETQYAHTGKKRELLKPVIVCDNESAASVVEQSMTRGKAMIVAAAPFITKDTLNQPRRRDLPCYFNVINHNQMTEVRDDYWRYYPARKMDFLSKLDGGPQ